MRKEFDEKFVKSKITITNYKEVLGNLKEVLQLKDEKFLVQISRYKIEDQYIHLGKTLISNQIGYKYQIFVNESPLFEPIKIIEDTLKFKDSFFTDIIVVTTLSIFGRQRKNKKEDYNKLIERKLNLMEAEILDVVNASKGEVNYAKEIEKKIDVIAGI